tara:strand:+ start:300 stop:1592 length:1293 start_codon:yes stop_codon:yes gene_type:complete
MTSTIKVNKIEKSDGSTLTLGGPSTAVTLACGATQSGFGRTGTVNWCTTAKTSPFTAESGKGYFVNTTSGGVTVTLPSSPSAGDIVSIKDYLNTFDSNAVTVGRNGSKISGACEDANLSDEGESVTLIYVDGTRGWLNTQTDDTIVGAYSLEMLVIAGGGAGGGHDHGGGGGAGGYRESTQTVTSGTTVTVTVGAGGAVGSPVGVVGGSGATSQVSGPALTTITSAGGGGGAASGSAPARNGISGGSGGGGAGYSGQPDGTGGSGNTPPVSPPQGNDGGNGYYSGGSPNGYPTGGGGGAGAAGGDGSGSNAGAGGVGSASSITGASVTRAGGGGGSSYPNGSNASGGTGGGGDGTRGSGPANAGTANTGGGGGGHSGPPGTVAGGAGGSGVVILSMPTANFSGTTSGTVATSTSGSKTILTYTGSGTYTT